MAVSVDERNLKGAALHRYFMRMALQEAEKAFEKEEVPVGAVLVKGREVISRGHNLVEAYSDITAHAEMLVLRSASRRLGTKYLSDCTLYVTLEPCPMCSGALVWAKLARVVFAAIDARAGACGSAFNLADNGKLNHRLEVIQGVCEAEAADLLRRFFRNRRPSP